MSDSWRGPLVLVPVLVVRPAAAAETRRPFPLVTAAGAPARRPERVPHRSARRKRRLRRVLAPTAPTARVVWFPVAERTTNALERVGVRHVFEGLDEIVVRGGAFERQHYRILDL